MNKKNITNKDYVYVVLLSVLLVLLIASVSKNYKKYINTEDLYIKKVHTYKDLKDKEVALALQNRYFTSDFGKEQILREKYNVTKVNEEVIALLPNVNTVPQKYEIEKTWWDYIVEFTGW